MPRDARQFVLEELLIVKAIPISAERVAVLCHHQPAAVEGVYITQVLSVDVTGQWCDLGRFKWHGVDMATANENRLTVVGRDGQVGSISDGVLTETWLEEGRALGPMRGIRSFNGVSIAFGMNRHVYIERQQGFWERFEKGFKADDDEEINFDDLLDQLGGINAVARTNAGQFVAVGMNGEIWRSSITAGGWLRDESGTNVALHDIVNVGDGSMVASGQAGVLLSNFGSCWAPIDYVGPGRLDFISAAEFANTMHLADGHSLRKLVNGTIQLVEVGAQGTMPCVRLASGHGLLVGCAPKELFLSRDGVQWTLCL